MTDMLISQEAAVRLTAFIVIFSAVAVLEVWLPDRTLTEARRARWPRNLALLALDSLVLRLMTPLLAVAVALTVAERGIGLFNRLDWPPWIEIPVSIVVLDLVLYAQHRLLHRLPPLWRLHRAHHMDRDLDITSGGRFHPFEMVLSMLIKALAVVALGAPVLAVILFEILLNGGSLFSHANLRLPDRLDRILRWAIVTPAMHRIHHSEDRLEHNSNFGFALSCWDRLFGSYRATAAQADFVLGLSDRREPGQRTLRAILLDPMRRT